MKITSCAKIFLAMRTLVCLSTLVQRCFSACKNELGMENGNIKDSQITALNWLYSDQNFNTYYQPKYARLNNKKLGGGGWCSANIDEHAGAFIEIDLLRNTKVTAISSQGRGIGSEFIDEFGITYRRENDTTYREYKERGRWHIFKANNDTTTIFKNHFKRPIIARRVRIVPQGETFSLYCGRFEIYGCKWKKQKDHLVGYLLPLADKFADQDTRDYTYDGLTDTKLAFKAGGLGKLVDDEYSNEMFDVSSLSKWIAYKKRDNFMPFFQFDFDEKRRFNAIKFHMINKGSNIQVFPKVSIRFSNDGINFGNQLVYLTTAAERHSSSAFVITVQLSHFVAKHIKCIFTQSAKWMFFSEVEFTSASPNEPLPTRPSEPTKQGRKLTIGTKKSTIKELDTLLTTTRMRTLKKPTPRLFFSLPGHLTDFEVFKKPITATQNTTINLQHQAKTDDDGIGGTESSKSSGRQGSLSFPIIIAIVLGAIVISTISAVLIFRFIRKLGKNDNQTDGQRSKAASDPVQSPEFHELLISEKQLQPHVLMKGKVGAEQLMKHIMDSGYTSHGSAGGSVKDMAVGLNTGSSV